MKTIASLEAGQAQEILSLLEKQGIPTDIRTVTQESAARRGERSDLERPGASLSDFLPREGHVNNYHGLLTMVTGALLILPSLTINWAT